MTKMWDGSVDALMRMNPQAFVNFVCAGKRAHYLSRIPSKLKTWNLEVDMLLQVLIADKKALINIEIQTYNDSKMPERLLQYNVLAKGEYKLPVYSCVIYLLQDGNIKQSPLRWEMPDGQEVLKFNYESIEINQLTPEDILRMEEPTLLPFLPLTDGGDTEAVVEHMFNELQQVNHEELTQIGFTIAAMKFKKNSEVKYDWLKRRYENMYNLFRESPLPDEFREEGRQIGLQEGVQQGVQQGVQKGIQIAQQNMLQEGRQEVLDIIHSRFPRLEDLAQTQVQQIAEPRLLYQLATRISMLHDEAEVEILLLSVPSAQK
jgi:predicted transposase YdaD